MVQPDRIRQAREVRGLTQTELARAAGINQSAIAQYEGGRIQPTEPVLAAIALRTGFPPAFFRKGPPPEFSLGSLLFRSLRSTTARERTQARRYGEIAYECAIQMADQVRAVNPLRLPRLDQSLGAERTAELTRASLGLGPDTPVKHLVNLIERAGVLVLALPVPLPKRDAFSLWTNAVEPKPVVILSGQVSGDRLRFSVAHEVGHLVMHHAIRGSLPIVERDANRFAAAFLMPEAAMRAEILRPVTLGSLAELKPRWGVAIQALIMRAHALGMINGGQYAALYQSLSVKGWRTHEPIELPVEKPRAFRKMAELLYGIPVDARSLAADADLPLPLVADILAVHAGVDEVPRKALDDSNVVRFRLRDQPNAPLEDPATTS
jgi:Zn-dependent peptidase ImmA (M78 family)/transcriptional regulator with XRE-family HTH domain